MPRAPTTVGTAGARVAPAQRSPKAAATECHLLRKPAAAGAGLTRVRAHVALQLVGVLAGIAAQAALEGALPRVRADVALQLAGLVGGKAAEQGRAASSAGRRASVTPASASEHTPPRNTKKLLPLAVGRGCETLGDSEVEVTSPSNLTLQGDNGNLAQSVPHRFISKATDACSSTSAGVLLVSF